MSSVTATRMVLQIDGATKRYGDTLALGGLSLRARSGEITGIAGPNGAGKSTLVKALAGEVQIDSGSIVFGEESTDGATSARAARTAVVHQETSLFPNLTVAQNLALSRTPKGYGIPKITEADLASLASLGILEHRNRKVIDCSLVVRQLTEIARAFVLESADVLLLDEPNSALTGEESTLLFDRVADIREQNRIVLLVSHRLEDLVTHCDRVFVVRDGRVTSALSGSDLSESAIARELVVDAHLTNHVSDSPVERIVGSSSLVATGWTHRKGRFRDVELTCRSGEITAIVGNEGSGGRELLRSLAGFEPATGSRTLNNGDHVVRGFAAQYMPAERQVSLFTNLNCGQNVTSRLGVPDIATRWRWMRSRAIKSTAQELLDRFVVRGGGRLTNIRALSGGNQQKVAIAAAVAGEPAVLLLEEPTRGVDISSKAEIYRLLVDYAQMDRVVVVFCSEMPEVFELADQVLVVSEGAILATQRVSDFASVADLAHAVAELSSDLPTDTDPTERN
jgi:ABC-type sugar transport system ATPase subunit